MVDSGFVLGGYVEVIGTRFWLVLSSASLAKANQRLSDLPWLGGHRPARMHHHRSTQPRLDGTLDARRRRRHRGHHRGIRRRRTPPGPSDARPPTMVSWLSSFGMVPTTRRASPYRTGATCHTPVTAADELLK